MPRAAHWAASQHIANQTSPKLAVELLWAPIGSLWCQLDWLLWPIIDCTGHVFPVTSRGPPIPTPLLMVASIQQFPGYILPIIGCASHDFPATTGATLPDTLRALNMSKHYGATAAALRPSYTVHSSIAQTNSPTQMKAIWTWRKRKQPFHSSLWSTPEVSHGLVVLLNSFCPTTLRI